MTAKGAGDAEETLLEQFLRVPCALRGKYAGPEPCAD